MICFGMALTGKSNVQASLTGGIGYPRTHPEAIKIAAKKVRKFSGVRLAVTASATQVMILFGRIRLAIVAGLRRKCIVFSYAPFFAVHHVHFHFLAELLSLPVNRRYAATVKKLMPTAITFHTTTGRELINKP
jgi:hypothetical protein